MVFNSNVKQIIPYEQEYCVILCGIYLKCETNQSFATEAAREMLPFCMIFDRNLKEVSILQAKRARKFYN